MRSIRPLIILSALTLLLSLGAVFWAGAAPTQPEAVYHGNVQSRIYHRQSCRYFDCKACTVVFKSKEEAEKAGYRPCKVCRP
jgi:hypothetical protein